MKPSFIVQLGTPPTLINLLQMTHYDLIGRRMYMSNGTALQFDETTHAGMVEAVSILDKAIIAILESAAK